MRDTIYRDEAINSIYKLKKTVIKHDVLNYRDGLSDALEIVQDLPSVDRPQGEWITVWDEYGENENGYECSVCGAEVDEKFPNCPYCLARMKGADDEAN